MSHPSWRYVCLPLLCLVFGVVAAGCGSAATPTPTPNAVEVKATAEAVTQAIEDAYPLAPTAWDAVLFGQPATGVPPLPGTRASVIFFWDRYLGFDGCSWFMGVYSATMDGELHIETPLSTPHQCASDDLLEQSSLFTAYLLSATNYTREGDQIMISTVGDQQVLTLGPQPPLPMLGTEWELKFGWVAEAARWHPVLLDSQTTITFGKDGEASGLGGCNDYTVSYTGDLQIEKVIEATDSYAELPTLTFGPVAASMATCDEPENIMDQEQSFFVALDSTAYYLKLGGMLILLDAEGVPLLMLAAND